MTIFRYSNCNLCLHSVISHSCFWASDFFYCVLVSSNLSICKCQIVKGNNTIRFVLLRLNNVSRSIFKDKSKLTVFKGTSCKGFAEVKSSLNWSNYMVVEDSVICICCFTTWWSHFSLNTQKTCCSIFRNGYFHADCHFIVVYIGNVSFHFFNSVVVDTFFIKWQFTEVNLTVSFVAYSFINIVITS